MQPANHHIADLLGIEPPGGLLAWHESICTGFPSACLKTLAKELGLTVKELSASVGAGSARKHLTSEASNSLYRVATLWCELRQVFPDSREKACSWLRQPCVQLRGRVPLSLVNSSLGYEYVKAALAREFA